MTSSEKPSAQSSLKDGTNTQEAGHAVSLHELVSTSQVKTHNRSRQVGERVFQIRGLLIPRRWQRVPFVSLKASPPRPSLEDADLSPEAHASWFSRLTFNWVTPILSLGYARPLEAPDLYKLQDDFHAAYIGDKITESFERRHKAASEYNERLLNGEIKPSLHKRFYWTLRGERAVREKHWRENGGQKRASLILAMNDSVKWWFWTGGVAKVISDTAQVTSPLLVKV